MPQEFGTQRVLPFKDIPVCPWAGHLYRINFYSGHISQILYTGASPSSVTALTKYARVRQPWSHLPSTAQPRPPCKATHCPDSVFVLQPSTSRTKTNLLLLGRQTDTLDSWRPCFSKDRCAAIYQISQ